MAAGTLQEAFIDELRDAYDAERQLVKALPKMAKAATSGELRAAFEQHLEETRGHVDRLTEVLEGLGEKVRGKHCDGMAGIIEEAKTILDEDVQPDTLDACLIAAAQRAEHYEMAAYGTLVAWANVLGHGDAAARLAEVLDEEKATDQKLNGLAEGRINQQAARGAGAGEDREEAMAATSARGDGGRGGAASRTARKQGALQ
jgi:ferritin-like metal-binding protein YciE